MKNVSDHIKVFAAASATCQGINMILETLARQESGSIEERLITDL